MGPIHYMDVNVIIDTTFDVDAWFEQGFYETYDASLVIWTM